MVPKQKFIILFISLFILCSCSKSTTPELPKPRAVIEVSVKDENDLTFYYSASMDYWYAYFTVVVSEHNGVGGTVTTCKLQFTLEDEHVSSSTYSGGTFPPKFNIRGTFPPYGRCEIYCSPTISSSKTWDLLTITVEGRDNNGYAFEKSIYYSYTWGTNNSKIIRNMLKKISYISGQR